MHRILDLLRAMTRDPAEATRRQRIAGGSLLLLGGARLDGRPVSWLVCYGKVDGDGCDCVPEALCRHGWEWRDPATGGCRHDPDPTAVYESLADALRYLREYIVGWDRDDGPRVRLIRGHRKWDRRVLVMNAEDGVLVDDHDRAYWPTPRYVVLEIDAVRPRSRGRTGWPIGDGAA